MNVRDIWSVATASLDTDQTKSFLGDTRMKKLEGHPSYKCIPMKDSHLLKKARIKATKYLSQKQKKTPGWVTLLSVLQDSSLIASVHSK